MRWAMITQSWAGLTGEEDLNENVFESVKKRLPWLIALLFLGMLVLLGRRRV